MKTKINLFSLITILIVSASCIFQEQITPTTINTVSLANTVTPAPTINTSLPTASQQTPTIDSEKLFKSCLFPCWAEIIPGQTSWEDAFNILSKSVASNTIPLPLTLRCKYGSCHSFSWQYSLDDTLYSGMIFEKEDLLYSISISGETSIKYNIYEVLENYGQPDKVFLSASSFTPEGKPYLILILLYENEKFVARYMWWATFDEDKIKACGISELFSIGIVDIQPGNWTDFDITRGGYQSVQSATIENFKPLNEVSEFSVSSFYESAIQFKENFCVSTLASYWE